MMASATNAAPPTNPSTGNSLSSTASQKDAPTRQSNKPAGNVKMTDRGRKESPVDQGRRAPAQKAWTSGTNPLIHRGSTPVQPNGSNNHTKAITNSNKMVGHRDGGLSDKHSHDRLRFILGGAIGLTVLLSTKSGDRFEGIFAGSSLSANNSKITLKMAKKLSGHANSQANGVAPQEAALVGTSPDHALTFDIKDMVDLSIPQFSLPEAAKQPNGTTSSFQTDTDISANVSRGNDRVLQKWVPDGPDTTDFSLESGNIGQWDQFAAHKQRFGDNSTYDENMYTTTIDRSAPGYKQREANANRKAQEILGQTSANPHIREERGLALENDFEDEEDKYSGVRRENGSFPPLPVGGPNKYVPPAQRAPTGQATVPGVPVDSAIISAQLSKPNTAKAAPTSKPVTPPTTAQQPVVNEPADQTPATSNGTAKSSTKEKVQQTNAASTATESTAKAEAISAARSPQRSVDNPTDDVEVKVLDVFRQFAKSEKERIAEKKRAQANQDRTAKINDLLRFHKNFKLKTPIPTDLVGILAKDPAKQEAIIERAQREHEESKSTNTSTSASTAPAPVQSASVKSPTIPKFDASQIPAPIPDRATFNRARGGHQQHGSRSDRTTSQQGQISGRGGAQFTSRVGVLPQDRRNQVPAPIPIADVRSPPTGPMADHSQSPQRSDVHTPTSASSRFNVKAMEFRPNVNAPTFNPSAPSVAASSPSSVQKAELQSRAASPSSFFGSRKPKGEKLPASAKFNPIKRMQEELQKKKNKPKSSDKPEEPIKEYPHNGGIPNAYHTGPVWQVKSNNQEKSYTSFFTRSGSIVSPSQTRSSSTQNVPYQGQLPAGVNGVAGVPQISTPQHGAHAGAHTYAHQFEDQRMHMHAVSPPVYPSPGMSSRQMSNFSSPMAHQAQLAYGQPQYYGGPAQMNIQMRPFPTTPGMMHAQPGQMTAPMMVQQQSSGPYMAVPQHYNQMPIYSPNAAHVYPQQNGYPSPGRMAPMMMHQSSQQSHHGGQQMMYAVPGQAGPMMYQQQGQMGMMRGGYGGAPYGSSPHQAHHMQQRAMSSGYGKGIPQVIPQNQGPPPNAPQQPAAFGQAEAGSEDIK